MISLNMPQFLTPKASLTGVKQVSTNIINAPKFNQPSFCGDTFDKQGDDVQPPAQTPPEPTINKVPSTFKIKRISEPPPPPPSLKELIEQFQDSIQQQNYDKATIALARIETSYAKDDPMLKAFTEAKLKEVNIKKYSQDLDIAIEMGMFDEALRNAAALYKTNVMGDPNHLKLVPRLDALGQKAIQERRPDTAQMALRLEKEIYETDLKARTAFAAGFIDTLQEASKVFGDPEVSKKLANCVTVLKLEHAASLDQEKDDHVVNFIEQYEMASPSSEDVSEARSIYSNARYLEQNLITEMATEEYTRFLAKTQGILQDEENNALPSEDKFNLAILLGNAGKSLAGNDHPQHKGNAAGAIVNAASMIVDSLVDEKQELVKVNMNLMQLERNPSLKYDAIGQDMARLIPMWSPEERFSERDIDKALERFKMQDKLDQLLNKPDSPDIEEK